MVLVAVLVAVLVGLVGLVGLVAVAVAVCEAVLAGAAGAGAVCEVGSRRTCRAAVIGLRLEATAREVTELLCTVTAVG